MFVIGPKLSPVFGGRLINDVTSSLEFFVVSPLTNFGLNLYQICVYPSVYPHVLLGPLHTWSLTSFLWKLVSEFALSKPFFHWGKGYFTIVDLLSPFWLFVHFGDTGECMEIWKKSATQKQPLDDSKKKVKKAWNGGLQQKLSVALRRAVVLVFFFVPVAFRQTSPNPPPF